MPHAIILGITADIGRALAERLICDGWKVTVLGLDLKRVDHPKFTYNDEKI